MKLLLASLLLVYAVQSLPRFSRQLEDLGEYIPNDDDDDYSGGDYDGESEMTDESDGDDSFFENEKSRKSSRNAKVWEGHVEHDDDDNEVDWRKLQKPKNVKEMSGEELSELLEALFGSKKNAKPSEQPTQESESTGHPRQAASKSSRKFTKAGNARKMSVEDIDALFPTPPPFNPYKIGPKDDDDYPIFGKTRQTPEDEIWISDDKFPIELSVEDINDLFPTPPPFNPYKIEDILREARREESWREDRMPVDIKRGLIKQKNQQHKSARRGGYVRKGILDDIFGILHGQSTINIYTKPVDKKKE
ncbi:unnamed protein product [Caenorhabditis brenneri]